MGGVNPDLRFPRACASLLVSSRAITWFKRQTGSLTKTAWWVKRSWRTATRSLLLLWGSGENRRGEGCVAGAADQGRRDVPPQISNVIIVS